MQIRRARPADLAPIEALLEASDLPTSGVADHLETFYVLDENGALVGAIGLEVYGGAALLRSLAVSASLRRRGLASRLCDHVESEAKGQGVHALYLLTETAEAFFAARGYERAARGAAPPAIASTSEFSKLCPQSAAFMRRAV